eukprot:5141851-Ditylum_brightwellii.AAC.1
MFYQKLLSAENIGTTVDVLAGSTFDACRWIPIKSEYDPTIQYPQGDLDASVFSSCARTVFEKKDTLHFLIDTLWDSPKLYTPKRLKHSNDTVDTLKT